MNQKFLIIAFSITAIVLSDCRALSTDYKAVGHFGQSFGTRKTYYLNQRDKVTFYLNSIF